ncbi:MAG: hypothetical protein FVQ80_19505 [Planctomycetes bacterium]|nr:hypothetical protein [Planctomycetota bacterium]
MNKTIFSVVFATVVILSSFSQTEDIDRIREIYYEVENEINDKELLITKIVFNSNDFPVDANLGYIDLVSNPYKGQLRKVVKSEVISLRGKYLEYVYYPSGQVAFVFMKIEEYPGEETEEYRFYF